MASQEEASDSAVELIADGDGLAVVGEKSAVERFLRGAGLWSGSIEIDLRRLKPLLGVAADVAQSASQTAADSGRWIKLTEESARIVKEHGLMETKTPGVSHVIVGTPGEIRNWLQAERGLGTALSNPAALSGVAGVMAQLATHQATAEITEYLARIDVKVDDVLRKHDDAVVSRMIGAGIVIEEAAALRETSGLVSHVTWEKVAGTSESIASTQAYALLQLKSIAEKLEGTTNVRRLAETTGQAETDVREWLAVLARCAQLQGLLDELELELVLGVRPDELDQHRLGLLLARQSRLAYIAQHTEPLLDRIDAACGSANARLLWNRTNALATLASGNDVAAEVHDFHELLGIDSVPRAWEPQRLDRVPDVAAQAIQKTKDATPKVVGAVGLIASAALLKNKLDGPDSTAD